MPYAGLGFGQRAVVSKLAVHAQSLQRRILDLGGGPFIHYKLDDRRPLHVPDVEFLALEYFSFKRLPGGTGGVVRASQAESQFLANFCDGFHVEFFFE